MSTPAAAPPADRPFAVGRHTFRSRLIVGTGKYASFAQMRDAMEASGAEMVTVALRRVDLSAQLQRGRAVLDLQRVLARSLQGRQPAGAPQLQGQRRDVLDPPNPGSRGARPQRWPAAMARSDGPQRWPPAMARSDGPQRWPAAMARSDGP